MRRRQIRKFWSALFVLALCAVFGTGAALAKGEYRSMKDRGFELAGEFGVVVGEVDEDIRKILGLQRAEGVVVYEVIAGRPADLAGIKAKSVIKEINKVEIKTLEDVVRALKAALPMPNFSVVTYAPADPANQGVSGGLSFHFVRILKD